MQLSVDYFQSLTMIVQILLEQLWKHSRWDSIETETLLTLAINAPGEDHVFFGVNKLLSVGLPFRILTRRDYFGHRFGRIHLESDLRQWLSFDQYIFCSSLVSLFKKLKPTYELMFA